MDAVPRTTAVELSSQANALHSSHMSSAALPTPRQRSFAGLAILGRGGGCMGEAGLLCKRPGLGLAFARRTPSGRRRGEQPQHHEAKEGSGR